MRQAGHTWLHRNSRDVESLASKPEKHVCIRYIDILYFLIYFILTDSNILFDKFKEDAAHWPTRVRILFITQ